MDETKRRNSKFAWTARTSNVRFLGVTVFGVAAALFARKQGLPHSGWAAVPGHADLADPGVPKPKFSRTRN